MSYLRVLLRSALLLVTLLAFTATTILAQGANELFGPPTLYSPGGFLPYSVTVGDFNGDGKLDLAVANRCGSPCARGIIGVLLGNGDGTLQAAVPYDSGGNLPTSVTVGDFNGDGRLDLAVANNCANGNTCPNGVVSVLLGNGDGTFQAAVPYDSGGNLAYSVTVGDFNGDGRLDLAVANNCARFSGCANGSVSVLLGNGNGAFQAAVPYASGGYLAYSVALGDVNRDSKLDLLVGNSCAVNGCANGTVGVLLGNGDGTFQAPVPYIVANSTNNLINNPGGSASSVAVADVNGDGNPDLLLANQAGGSVDVLLGNGNGTFQAAVAYNPGGSNAFSVALGDFNADGKLDLAVGNGNGVGVLLGNGDGTFRTAVTCGSGGDTFSVAVGDVNSDRKVDLLVANQGTSTVGVLLNKGTTFLTFPLHSEMASTAIISTVMDHHIKDDQGNPQFYASDKFIDAYTGEEGAFGCAPATSPCVALDAQGNAQSRPGYKNTMDQQFVINSYYTGGKPCYDESNQQVVCQSWLFYEGHPGFDYPADLGTSVYAPAAGVAFIPDCDPVTRGSDCTGTSPGSAVDGFNILTIDHGNGYSTWYLHMGDLEKVNKESATIPQAPFQVTVAHAAGFQADIDVLYSTKPSKKLKRVSSNPSSGQYTVSTSGVYTFSSADSGLGVLISYYYAVDFRVIACPGQSSIALYRGDGQRVPVTPQCTVGEVGNKAVNLYNKPLILGAHLHFEVRKGLIKTSTGAYQCVLPNCVPVDPYGWKSTTRKDPYPFGPNILLWNDPNL